ncbi:nucleotidyltransferase family protein [Azohydromonas aeria]|uniref:nucleotidyltransferase family protein n=1 Tax=Azohydromonas aeria TaxID=2590212 RepID=UPI0018DFEAD0|nr:nucleotidyltransferase domain-containing protein [Azohydromonas aeria]
MKAAIEPMPAVALRPAEWDIVRAILARWVPDRPVWAFGSRVTGRCKPYSDLDLAVGGAQRLPASLLAALAEAFVESDLPFKVDVLDWNAADASFKSLVSPQRVPVQPGTSDDSQRRATPCAPEYGAGSKGALS